MKLLAFFIFFFAVQTSFAQNVRFSNAAFDNGLIYPVAEYSGNPESVKKFNENILSIVSIYEHQDYCISQNGFVQHNNFIQLNFYFNCIDMESSKTESYLFSLESGEKCVPSAMFAETNDTHNEYVQKRIIAHYTANGIEAPEDFIKTLTIDDCDVNLLEKGIEISLKSREDWPKTNLLITWSELSPYLKHLRSR